MEIAKDAEGWHLIGPGRRIALSDAEKERFRRMTPLGRKVTLRKRALEQIARDPLDAEAREILALFRLPAREWDFRIPD